MARMAWDNREILAQPNLDPVDRQAGLLGLFGAFCFFVVVVYVILLGRGEIDAALLEALRQGGAWIDPWETYWVEQATRDLASAGSLIMIGLVVGGATLHLLLSRGWATAAMLLITLSGGALVALFLKFAFGRGTGAAFSAQWLQMFSGSFPSANAVVSAIVYPTLGAVLAVAYGGGMVGRFILASAAVTTVLVGLSRAYLHMHLPTDVLAGWSAGLAWASLCWIVMRRTYGWKRLR
jgi:undecaprenyl-diphosphatase